MMLGLAILGLTMSVNTDALYAGYLHPEYTIDHSITTYLEPSIIPPEPFSTSTLIAELWGKHAPRMQEIARCESQQRQFVNGKPIQSPTRDFGYFQINEKTWDAKAKELGLDYKNSVKDNIYMAKHVWDVQSFDAWVCHRLI